MACNLAPIGIFLPSEVTWGGIAQVGRTSTSIVRDLLVDLETSSPSLSVIENVVQGLALKVPKVDLGSLETRVLV